MTLEVRNEPAVIVTTGGNEAYIFADNGLPEPEVTGLGAAILVTRLRWWADRIEAKANPTTPEGGDR
jgi:hypothetical protein